MSFFQTTIYDVEDVLRLVAEFTAFEPGFPYLCKASNASKICEAYALSRSRMQTLYYAGSDEESCHEAPKDLAGDYWIVRIKASLLPQHYYNIQYTWQFVSNHKVFTSFRNNKMRRHFFKQFPYFNQVFLQNSIRGDIIAKNKMTDEVVHHLCMRNENLAQVCGATTPTDYRHHIIMFIANLWD